MNLSNKLKSLAVELERKNNSLFEFPLSKQKIYIRHFAEPRDDIERSYYQYRCQMKFNNPIISCFLNLASFLMMLIYLYKPNEPVVKSKNVNGIFFSDGKPETIIPDELRQIVGTIEVVNTKKEYLTKEDKRFIRMIGRRYPFSWQFQLKCLMKIRFYRYEIERIHPLQIIVCNEYSFTSSVMTQYCEALGIKHINVMHGEKLYFMRDSFFRFHECYVWDENYIKLFKQLRAEDSQFRIAIPPSLRFDQDNKVTKTIDYTYYLGAEKDSVLQTIVEAMVKLQNKGYKVVIRPHPRYSDINEIRNVAPNIEIEDINKVKIEKSLLRTKNAISVYSTVLNQAYCNGIGVVIDDVSDCEKYKRLREIQYIMLSKKHDTLSNLLEMEK